MNWCSSSEMQRNSDTAKGVVGEKWHGSKFFTCWYVRKDMTFGNLFLGTELAVAYSL